MSALGKPMVLLLEENEKHTFLVTGLETLANVEFVWPERPSEISDQLDVAVQPVLARSVISAITK